MALKIHIADDLPGRHIVHYTLRLIAVNKEVEFIYTPHESDAHLQITNTETSDIPLCLPFYQILTAGDFAKLRELANGSYHFLSIDGRADRLASIFYLVNCLQEYDALNSDKYGRYPYADSLQNKKGILQKNIVQGLINEFLSAYPALAPLAAKKRRSGFLLTHDIDTIYGSKNQNGHHALKTGRLHHIPKLLWNHYIGTPDWLNMDKIMVIEQKYGFTSTFYWLVHQDTLNADYDISSPAIQKQIALIRQRGFEIGLHKSIGGNTFEEELTKLGGNISGQRYHFLKFNLPQAWDEIERAGLSLDTSLGFSEDFGFRNSYGLPFRPFNFKDQKSYNFIEVPMQVMDRTFFNQNKPVAQIEKEILTWLDANKEACIITLNFHNNFFDSGVYAGYGKVYEAILSYFRQENWTCMTQRSLIDEFIK